MIFMRLCRDACDGQDAGLPVEAARQYAPFLLVHVTLVVLGMCASTRHARTGGTKNSARIHQHLNAQCPIYARVHVLARVHNQRIQ